MKKWLVGLLAAGLCAASAWADTVDVLTRETTGVSGSNYKDWTATGDSGTAYAGNSAGGNDAIQLRSNNNNSGIVTTDSIGNATKVKIVWNENTAADRVVDVYGKNTAYDSPADLYDKDKQGDKLGSFKNADGEATELTIDGDFAFIGLRSSNQALYLDSVEIEWAGGTPPAFSIKLDPAEDFTVVQGKSASITATVKGAQGDVSYSWSVDGTPIDLAGNVYEIDSAEVGGPYEVACEASDGVSDPVSASVKYSVVEAPVVSGDQLTRETTGVTGTSYKDWTATGDSGTEYAGNSAGGNDSIQLRTTSPAGIVITKSAGSDVASVTVEWNDATAEGRKIAIYGSTAAYDSPADLYGDGKGELLGEIAKGETTLEVSAGYPYIGILAKGGALYLTSVAIDFADSSMLSVSFDQDNPLKIEKGTAASVTAIARGGEAPYSYVWTSDTEALTGTEATLAIPATLAVGTYTTTVTVTDKNGVEVPKPFGIIVQTPAVPHAITVNTDGNGTVTATPSEARVGESVALTISPTEGFKLESLTAVDGEGSAIEITNNSFTMPDSAVTVSATFVEKPVLSGDVLTRETTGVTGTSYKDWTATGDSGAEYAGNSAGGNDSIQLRTTSPAGIVITKSAGSDVTSVMVEWNDATAEGRKIAIYGSTAAYAGPADLYGDGKGELLGEIAKGETTLEVPAGYPYIGILAKGGALYLTSVAIDFGGAPAAFSIALNPAEDFEVVQGKDASITATVRGAQGDVSYSWSVNGTPIDLAGNVYAIDSAEIGGPYEVVCEASDGVSDPVSASVSYSVVEAPPVTGDEFTLISSVDDLEDGAEYVITDNSQAYAMKAELSTGSTKRLLNESVTPVEGVITTEDASIIWKLVAVEDGSFAFYNESIGKYIGWSSGNSAKFQDDAFANTISYDEDIFVVMATSTAELEKPRKLQFNSATNSLQFAYYEGTQKNLCFFKKSGAPTPKITFEGDTTVQIPGSFALQFKLSNYEGSYDWAVTSREGGSINSTGLYTWKPTEATDGIDISVAATAGGETIATKTVTLVVEPADAPVPTVTCDPASPVTVAAGVEQTFVFTASNFEAVYWDVWVNDEHQDSLDVDGNTATFTWTANEDYKIEVQATDADASIEEHCYVDVTVTGAGPQPGDKPYIKGIKVDAKAGNVTLTLSDSTGKVKTTTDLTKPELWTDYDTPATGGTLVIPITTSPMYFGAP